MNKHCKHGHIDGAMHSPCKDCRIEYLEALVSIYEKQLPEHRHVIAYAEALSISRREENKP